jgi:hypothetical protein
MGYLDARAMGMRKAVQRPLPDAGLRIVVRGADMEDKAGA